MEALFIVVFLYMSRMLFKCSNTVKECLTFLFFSAFAFHSWEKNLGALNKFKYESKEKALKISCEGTLCI